MTVGDETSVASAELSWAEDYRALRHDVGALELGRDVLRVSGVDAVQYLQGQLSQDVAALAVGQSADSLILTPQGKLDALVRVSRPGTDELILDVEAGFGEAVAARLARFKLRVKAVIEPLDWRCVALRGPRADAAAQGASGAGTALAPAFSWNGVAGVDLLGEAPAVPTGVRACSIEAWESLRVEAGIPAMGAELDERTIGAEAQLLERSVSFTKGCYTGQELVARLDARGNRVARHLRGLVVAPRAGIDPAVAGSWGVGPGSEIVVGGKVIGTLTSVAWSPALESPAALGYVHRTVEPGTIVEVRAVEGRAVEVRAVEGETGGPGRGRGVAAEVRGLPLI